MNRIDELREKMHSEAATASRQMAQASASTAAQIQAKGDELARRNHSELMQRYAALYQARHEQGAELQEAQHQVAALRQSSQPDFQRGAELTFRAQWLEDQIAQKDQQLEQLKAQISGFVARDAQQRGREVKAEHNRLVQEREARKAALVEQLKAVEREYDGRLAELRQELFTLTGLTPIDMDLVGIGVYREL